MDLGLNGKVALVTGGSKGIGRACAERLAQEGCDVLIVARTARDLEQAAAAIGEASGRRVEICATDLRSAQGCEAAIGALKHAFGRLDILVNNAGATQSGDFFKLDDAIWEDGFALKFYSYVRLSRALWPLLKDAQGSVVNIIGGASKTPTRQLHDRRRGQRRDHQLHQGARRAGSAGRRRGQGGASRA